MSHQSLIKTANRLMATAVVLCLAAMTAAFLLDQYLTIPQQIMGHAGLLLGATLLKIGYVVRLTGVRKRQLLEV